MSAKGAIEAVVNYVIDKDKKRIHKANCPDVSNLKHVVTAENLNPAYIAEHGYTAHSCMSEGK
jgi:hypothetical protein